MTLEILIIIVLANVIATVMLLRVAVRKPDKLKKKFLTALHHSEPIVPKHQPPKIARATGKDQQFFVDFEDFASVINWWLEDQQLRRSPWRLQELPDAELKIHFSDMPMYGRRYFVFYNEVCLGNLEISPGFRYSTETPNVHIDIELRWVRLLTFETVQGFLSDVALHVCNDQNTNEHLQSRMVIDRALAKVLWDAQQIQQLDLGQDFGELELCLSSSASQFYFDRRQALRNKNAA